MLLLKQNTIKKKQIDKNKAIKLDTNDNDSKKYKIKKICNNLVYIRKSASHLAELQYLIF